MDMFSNVPSPSLNFLGTPSLSRLGSSFLGSSLIRRHTPEILPSLQKPLIPSAEEEKVAHRRSSHGLLPPIHPRKSSMKKIPEPSKDAHGLTMSRQSSYGQAVVNGKFSNIYVLSCGSFGFHSIFLGSGLILGVWEWYYFSIQFILPFPSLVGFIQA